MRIVISICRAGRMNAILMFPLVVMAACADGDGTVGPNARAQTVAEPQANVQQLRSGTTAIMDIADAAMAAWSAKDASAYAAIYSADMVMINPLGAVLSGRAAFEATHVFLFNNPFAGSTLTINVTGISFLTGTIALVYQDVTLTGYAFLPPGLPALDGVVYTRVTWVVVKNQGVWEIISQQMTPILAPH
jgi:uncharacterized protein (TIGR02246 family)